jgi:magnesium transporter
MYARIENDQICPSKETEFLEKDETICVMTEQEWEEREALRSSLGLPCENTVIHFCKLENQPGYLAATFRIPPKQENEVSLAFSMYLLPGKMVFLDNGKTVETQMEKIAQKKIRNGYTLERFLYDFLSGLLEEDLLFLQKLEREIAVIEEMVLKGSCPGFNGRMLNLKKRVAKFYRYYTQLADVGQELLDNEMEFFGKEELRMFDRYRDKVVRLAGETQILRDYAMQVQDVYQSEISIRQNDIMKMLTVVTTIFLPLTLIAGWYGMNFAYMPELTMKYAYPVVIGISILIVVVSLVVFKKKRYW